ncbi:MAG: hypothetical protein SF066_14115 [Thermoanaerobaculia bacterium]|nr:hypothetical protein [Thermoanaerobaculia bacterium]
METTPSELTLRLRDAGPRELAELVAAHLEQMTVGEAIQALRNSHVDTESLALVARERRLVSAAEVRRLLALHPRTPEAAVSFLIPTLAWPDLVAMGVEMRLKPSVRRAADRQLLARLPGLAVGEKITIARRAGSGLIEVLRHDPTPRVIAALLENPRLTEGLVDGLARSERASPVILELLARDRRWGVRHDLRYALVRNPRTPLVASLPLLPSLRKLELREVAEDRRLPEPLRQRAKLLLG